MAAYAEESYRFFGLEEDPFAPTADPGFFYFTREFERCLFSLKRSIDSRYGIVLIFGDIGVGKTTLMRHLFSHISKRTHLYNTGIIASPSPVWSCFDLMSEICRQFGVSVNGNSNMPAYQNAFNAFLYNNRNRINTLIIDDAQNLSRTEHIEILRLLQNLETPQHKLLNLVLFGQMELIGAIRSHPNFEQRVNNAHVLNPFSFEDTAAMIVFRLCKAGWPQGEVLFDDESVRLVYEISRGVPREIVTLCRNSLVVAARIGRRRIQRDIVDYTVNNITAKGLVSL